MKKVKFDVLDALRGLAAIFVVIRHSGEFFGGNPFYNSFLAVDIFFLLSGFVIAHAYDRKLVEKTISQREFILIRIIRFYPSYFISILLCLLVVALKGSEIGFSTVGNFALTLFFLPNFFQSLGGAPLFPINTVFWSLFYELLINIFYAITRRIKFKTFLILLTVISGIGIVCFAIKDGSIDNGYSWELGSIALGGARAFFGIFFGIYLYKIRENNLFSHLTRFSTIGPTLLLIAVLAAPQLPSFNWLFQITCVFVIFPICVLWGAKASNPRQSFLLVTLGLLSYPAYVLHVPTTQLLNHFFHAEIREYAPYSGVTFILMFVLFCICVERYYERPILHHLKAHFGNK